MRAAAVCGAALAILLAGCGSEESERIDALADAAVQGPAQAADAALPDDDTPVERAPSTLELSKLCPLGEGTRWDTLRGWVTQGDFAAFDAELQRTHDAYREHSACEHYETNLIEFLAGIDFEVLDRWIAARPHSWGAYTARGSKWVSTGYERRGTRFAKDVTEAQWKGIHEAFANAERDLMRATEIEPNGFMAYAEAIRRLQAAGGKRDWRKWLDALLARNPANYTVREKAMWALTPNWGGSLDEMRELAESAQAHADRQPRLRKLLGFPYAEQAQRHFSAQRYAEAAALYRRALRHSHAYAWYDGLAYSLRNQEDWKGVLEVADTWIAALDQAQAHYWRGRALRELGQPKEALAAFDKALEYAPNEFYMLQERAVTRRALGQLAEAAADQRRALELRTSDHSIHELSELAAADPKIAVQNEPLARALIEKNPKNHAALFMLASALHARGAADARAALERYVAQAQDDGDEWARLAQAMRMLNPPPPGGRLLPAIAYVGLAPVKR